MRTPSLVAFQLAAAVVLLPALAAAQTVAAPTQHPMPVSAARPVPGPVVETPGFTRAVERGTRTRTGEPGKANWVQSARYRIEARLDPRAVRLTGQETAVYLNRSPDTLSRVAVYLRQNLFAPGSPRRQAVPITGGMALNRITVGGTTLSPVQRPRRRGERVPPGYLVDGTILWIQLPHPILPGDSASFQFGWAFTPAPKPADGREGHDGHVFFLGYWYPQFAVYDDVNGWVTDPYLNGAEFYMDPADYDVRLTVPSGWVVDATGTLRNPEQVYSRRTRQRLAAAWGRREPVHVIAPDEVGRPGAFASESGELLWHFTADRIRDFAWGTSNRYAWDAASALVRDSARGVTDTVAISSFFRLTPEATAWRAGGARFTRDAIEQLSAYLWPYPWPHMTSMEGILTGGGMEYPMMTIMQPWDDTLSLAGDLMHETGHMWFPMQVGSNETRYPWMDEGLTQFDVAQAMRPLYGEPRTGGRYNDSEQGQRILYLQAERRAEQAPLMQWGDLYPQQYYFMYYDKTAQVLGALRGLMGEVRFHQALREYGRRWLDRHPMPEDFFNSFDQAAGRDLGWFWTTWFYQSWPLDQAIGTVEAEGDSVAISIEDRALAPMPVDLAVTRDGGRVDRVVVPVEVWLKGARRTVVRVPRLPRITRIEIDPDGNFPDLDRANQRWPHSAADSTGPGG